MSSKIDARNGAPKRLSDNAVHPGMHSRQMGNGGRSHASADVVGGETIVTSAAAAPVAASYGTLPKSHLTAPVAITPGHRNRSRDIDGTDNQARGHQQRGLHQTMLRQLGQKILAQAVVSGSTKLRSTP